MKLAIVADSYVPMRTSAAVQLKDLVAEFVSQGHQPYMIVPDSEISEFTLIEKKLGAYILRVKTPQIKDVGYIRRTFLEWYMPYTLFRGMKKSNFVNINFEGVVWYSPSIFFGPLIKALKKKNNCRTYLILRDIFPEWAVNMGMLNRGLPYLFFKLVEAYQYSIANVIGIQSPSDSVYLKKWSVKDNHRVEVLHNWLAEPAEPAEPADIGDKIIVQNTKLSGRKIFVYAGNMGIAQGVGRILDIVAELDNIRLDIGFLFVGRGSEVQNLRNRAEKNKLSNVVFFDEIPPEEIPSLYAQCDFGLVVLDPRHKTHNIPGKFISYMKNGLPVLACINPGNDLAKMISDNRVGYVSVDLNNKDLISIIENLVDEINKDSKISDRCKVLARELFSPKSAVEQIVSALEE